MDGLRSATEVDDEALGIIAVRNGVDEVLETENQQSRATAPIVNERYDSGVAGTDALYGQSNC
jgi:hypothetical protein